MPTQQVRIKSIPADQTAFVKALRLIGRTTLKQAHDLAIHLDRFRDSVVVAGVDPVVAEHIVNTLRESGAEAVVEACSIDTPMLCCPEANSKYRWGMFRTIKKAI